MVLTVTIGSHGPNWIRLSPSYLLEHLTSSTPNNIRGILSTGRASACSLTSSPFRWTQILLHPCALSPSRAASCQLRYFLVVATPWHGDLLLHHLLDLTIPSFFPPHNAAGRSRCCKERNCQPIPPPSQPIFHRWWCPLQSPTRGVASGNH